MVAPEKAQVQPPEYGWPNVKSMTTSPYGTWISPLSAADLAQGEHPVEGGIFIGGQPWWSELRSSEGGRYVVRRQDSDGTDVDVLPSPWNARTRVHEYGGRAWTVTPHGTLIFAEFSDQRLYRLDPGSDQPTPITPEPATPTGLRYAELSINVAGTEVWCVRESHRADGEVTRDVAAIPLDGSAATDATRIRSVVSGSHFLAGARVSPDGRQLAWIAWEHPQMPWDGTELRVASIGADGRCGAWRTVAGSSTESMLQPEWIDDDSVYVISDRTGWWNIYRVEVAGAAANELREICPLPAEFGAPLWQLGASWYSVLPDGRLLAVRTLGLDTLCIIDPDTGTVTDLPTVQPSGELTTLRLGAVDTSRPELARVLVRSAGPRTPHGLRMIVLSLPQPAEKLDVTSILDIRLSIDGLPATDYLPPSYPMTFGRGERHATQGGDPGREVHAFVYPPANPDFTAPAGELPPFIAFVHGGPTAHVAGMLNLTAAYFTSRGIGVIDVNYGGSTGYGRAYRERLRGQWGIVDVQDVVTAVHGLSDAGLADPARLAIEGGSAGGWTVLSALTLTNTFACGVSYFGVAELLQFAEDTHDFESRYLDGLIGPLPQAHELYVSRAPVNNVDGLSCPVLLLQGLDDPIVPPSQAEKFRDALLAKGLTHAYVAYEGESHGFRKTETIIHASEAELSFYGQVMGFVPVDIPVLPLVN